MILNTTSKTIQVIMGQAAVTTEPEYTTAYEDINVAGGTFVPAASDGPLNGTSIVTIVASPASSVQRRVKEISIFNADTVTQTFTVQYYDGSNTENIIEASIPTLQTLWYGGGSWQVLPIPGVAGPTGPAGVAGPTGPTGPTGPISPGGLVNKFRNGTMDVWQRGTSAAVTTAGAYSADGWIVKPTGANASWAQVAGRKLTSFALQAIGAAGVTDMQVKQRIEGSIAAALCSGQVTIQAQLFNDTGATVVPTLTVGRATGADNGTYTNLDVNAVNLQSCPNGVWTPVAYTFAADAASLNGLEIIFDFGATGAAKSFYITECDIRSTPGVATGLNSNPPPVEFRPIAGELTFCQRYFSKSFSYGTAPANAAQLVYKLGWALGTTTILTQFLPYPVTMRTSSPAITFYSPSSWTATSGNWSYIYSSIQTAASSTGVGEQSDNGMSVSLTSIGLTSTGVSLVGGEWTASSEL